LPLRANGIGPRPGGEVGPSPVSREEAPCAPSRESALDGASLLPLLRAGIVFVDGVQQEGKVSKPKARAA
jgi:hypothetical protein